MKKLFLIMSLALSINAYTQEEKTVTLTVSGQGQTQDEAKQNALRNAIEQAFGAFISSKTEILNDELVKDEIVSVSNGNIQKFEVVSEVKIPDGGYATTLKAIVSVTKLTSFCESKGVSVEFKGSLFAFNINQQKINETNEAIAIRDIIEVTSGILKKSFYGIVKAGDPILENGDNYLLPLEIEIRVNNNVNSAINFFYTSIKNLSMSKAEIENYNSIKKPIFGLHVFNSDIQISGQMDFFEVEKYSCSGRPNCKGWRDKKCVFYEYEYPIYLGVKPDFKYKEYSPKTFIFRNDSSQKLIVDFVENVKKTAANFYILNQENLKLRYAERVSVGSIPISTLQDQFRFNYYSASNEVFYYDNVPDYYYTSSYYNLPKELRNIKGANKWEKIIVHQYQKDGLVLKVLGNISLNLDEIKNISNIKLQFN
jgi:hypothetical protein